MFELRLEGWEEVSCIRGVRGLCRERWVCVQRPWAAAAPTWVVALVFFSWSNAKGPDCLSFFHACSTVFLCHIVYRYFSFVLKICQRFSNYPKEQNKTQALRSSYLICSLSAFHTTSSTNPLLTGEFWSPGFLFSNPPDGSWFRAVEYLYFA